MLLPILLCIPVCAHVKLYYDYVNTKLNIADVGTRLERLAGLKKFFNVTIKRLKPIDWKLLRKNGDSDLV